MVEATLDDRLQALVGQAHQRQWDDARGPIRSTSR